LRHREWRWVVLVSVTPARLANPGKTRVCPHCRSEILASASVCPACRHHLKFGLNADQQVKTFSALNIEGTVTHTGPTAWEYAVVVSVRNERGEETARQVVSVGALQPADQRHFSLSVDVYTPDTDAKPAPAPPPAAKAPPPKSATVQRPTGPPPKPTVGPPPKPTPGPAPRPTASPAPRPTAGPAKHIGAKPGSPSRSGPPSKP